MESEGALGGNKSSVQRGRMCGSTGANDEPFSSLGFNALLAILRASIMMILWVKLRRILAPKQTNPETLIWPAKCLFLFHIFVTGTQVRRC